jgi:glycosyltransferase involved in cell wall biosynthesis
MLGFLSYEEYKEVLAKADICINAQLAGGTFGNYSFPSKLYEYLSCHKLIVSSDVADVRDALAEIAFIYEGDSAGELAGQIDRAIAVWRDPSQKAAYDEAMTQFIDRNSMDEIAKQTNQMLARL